MIKHIGFANIQADKGLIDMEKLIKHFMEINNVNRKTFEKHHEEIFKIWRERSRYKWEQDLGEYKK